MTEGRAEEEYVCRCFRVTQARILEAIREGRLRTVEEVSAATGAAGGCSSCYDDVQGILDRHLGLPPRRTAEDPLTDAEKRAAILTVFDGVVRRLFVLNGLDGHILGVERDRVFARIRGPGAGTTRPSVLTLKWFLVKMMSNACGRKMQLMELPLTD